MLAEEKTNMTDSEIKALIEKYNLVQRGDKIGTYKKGVDRAILISEVAPHKAEIIAYFEAEYEKERTAAENRKATLEMIPGGAKLRKARIQWAKWKYEFDKMMETGSSIMPCVEAPTASEIAAMEEQNPMAVFVLEAEHRAHYTENYQLAAIWTATYNALCDGKDPESVKAEHDTRMAQFVADHRWD